jgi:primosomal protein N'
MPVEVIGPAEAPIAKIKGRYRWQIMLKSDNLQALHFLTRRLLTSSASRKLERSRLMWTLSTSCNFNSLRKRMLLRLGDRSINGRMV